FLPFARSLARARRSCFTAHSSTTSLRHICDVNRGNDIRWHESEDTTIEVQLRFEGTFYILSFAEAVLLTGERDVCRWQPFGSQGVEHALALPRRHNFVFKPLKKQERGGDAFGRMDG